MHLREPFEGGIDQAVAGLEFGRGGDRGFAIPGADVLADVAAEDVASHAVAQVLGDGAALFDGEIGNAAVGIELVGREKRVRGTGVEAASAGAAAVGRRQVRRGARAR